MPLAMFTVVASASSEAGSSLLDSSVVTFIVDAIKQVLAIMTTPPLGTFITIGIIGAVVGLVATIVNVARRNG